MSSRYLLAIALVAVALFAAANAELIQGSKRGLVNSGDSEEDWATPTFIGRHLSIFFNDRGQPSVGIGPFGFEISAAEHLGVTRWFAAMGVAPLVILFAL